MIYSNTQLSGNPFEFNAVKLILSIISTIAYVKSSLKQKYSLLPIRLNTW
jgi:hypothetical protein